MRVVSLLPSATELAFALGLGDALVAVSHECDYPPEAAALPRITHSVLSHDLAPAAIDAAVTEAARSGQALYGLDADRLRELAPDLIVTQGVCSVCAVSADTVETALRLLPDCLPAGAATLSLGGKTVAGVMADIRLFARATGTELRGEALALDLEARWQALGSSSEGARPRVMMLEWTEPPFCGGHWVPEQVAAAGGENVMGGAGEDSRRTTWREIARADPDLLVVAACGYDLAANLEQARALYRHPEANGLRALREGGLWAVDANSFFSRPAPRLVRGAEILRAIFSGDLSSLRRGEAAQVSAPKVLAPKVPA